MRSAFEKQRTVQRVSHANGAGHVAPASERVRGLGTRSPDQSWSGLRESNPSDWLGKPGHYHYAKPALSGVFGGSAVPKPHYIDDLNRKHSRRVSGRPKLRERERDVEVASAPIGHPRTRRENTHSTVLNQEAHIKRVAHDPLQRKVDLDVAGW